MEPLSSYTPLNQQNRNPPKEEEELWGIYGTDIAMRRGGNMLEHQKELRKLKCVVCK